jgi:phage terminase large subunit-like protein
LKQAHQTMLNNLAKRKMADPWVLEITTAPEPGLGSVAEGTMEYAKAVHEGRIKDAGLLYFHRQASDDHDLTTEEGARAAVIEASGPAAAWRDIDAIVTLWKDPTTDRSFWERVWCNRLVQSSSQAFSIEQWRGLVKENPVKRGDLITLGFDGAVSDDATGLVATHVPSGHQWVVGVWECPPGRDDWKVPVGEVDAAVRATFEQYDVWRFYADPYWWQPSIAIWQGLFDEKRVIPWDTTNRKQMAYALDSFRSAMAEGILSHDDDPTFQRHIANARRAELKGWRNEEGKALWLIRKERPDSPQKIDLAMAAVLSWEARTDAISAGAIQGSVYERRGVLVM